MSGTVVDTRVEGASQEAYVSSIIDAALMFEARLEDSAMLLDQLYLLFDSLQHCTIKGLSCRPFPLTTLKEAHT